MTWPDIDIDLESTRKINDDDFFQITKALFNQDHIKHIIRADNRSSYEKNRPQSMYIGIVYDHNGVDWKIDIRYLDQSAAWASDDLNRIKSKLTPENTKTILDIKTALHNHSKYRKEFSGYDIYNAVLNKKISTIKEFRTSLEL
jgi:hypothetical protein